LAREIEERYLLSGVEGEALAGPSLVRVVLLYFVPCTGRRPRPWGPQQGRQTSPRAMACLCPEAASLFCSCESGAGLLLCPRRRGAPFVRCRFPIGLFCVFGDVLFFFSKFSFFIPCISDPSHVSRRPLPPESSAQGRCVLPAGRRARGVHHTCKGV